MCFGEKNVEIKANWPGWKFKKSFQTEIILEIETTIHYLNEVSVLLDFVVKLQNVFNLNFHTPNIYPKGGTLVWVTYIGGKLWAISRFWDFRGGFVLFLPQYSKSFNKYICHQHRINAISISISSPILSHQHPCIDDF